MSMAMTIERARPAGLVAGGILCLAASVVFSVAAPPLVGAFLAVLLGVCGLATLHAGFAGKLPRLSELAIDAGVIGAFVASRDDAAAIWQLPAHWLDLLRLTAPGAGAACAFYFASAAVVEARNQRHLTLRESLSILILPLLFNLLLSLGSTALMRELGSWLAFGAIASIDVSVTLARAVILFAFVEILVGALCLVMSGRLFRSRRLHALLFVAAAHAVLTPAIADLPQAAGDAGALAQFVLAVTSAALAQAGLWAIVFVLTGLAIDSLEGSPPIFVTAYRHWNNGFVKGAIYGGVFVFLLLAAAAAMRAPALGRLAASAPYLCAAIFGALLFPLAKTIVGSSDGTPPFFGRLIDCYRNPRSYLRGVVAGLGAALALLGGLPEQDGLSRFLALFLVGAIAFAGVDLVFDAANAFRGRRVMESWRIYALAALLGGLVGGALGWYFDAAQLNVVGAKFWTYAALSFPDSGRAVSHSIIYPWFSKWGPIDLGATGGGVRLFYNESLSGMINWSIAASLFSVNFFILAALFQRSLSPLKKLFSMEGFRELFEQTIRVMRWGLWMAPIINSFLRQAPDPTWYNQDGGVRTVAATFANLAMPAQDFRSSSLAVFTGLLAYDWLRVAIWFDHMGLRVATLVNLTFIGGDRADEAAARFAGHPARTRIIPDPIRRFATWAPLLIPFYIPRGAEWDVAWTGAEAIRASAPPMGTPVAALAGAYVLALGGACVAAGVIARRWSRRGPGGPAMSGVPHAVSDGPARFGLSNAFMGLELLSDGRGYSFVSNGIARGGHPIDVTRRPTDPLQLRGRFFYLRDDGDDEPWSIGYEPTRTAASDYCVEQPKPDRLRIANSFDGVRAEAEITLSEEGCVEIWRVRLSELSGRPRRLLLTSFQELALHEPGAYLRDPDFNAMHVETWFVSALNAVFARNRLLRAGTSGRMSKEVAFHAAGAGEGLSLLGYEDSRTRFIGAGDLRRPQGLQVEHWRSPDDQGGLYTFDPAASLTIAVDLPAGGSREIIFVNGHARTEIAAARVLAKHLCVGAPNEHELQAARADFRALEPLPRPSANAWPFAFSPTGDELRLTPRTPRPWAHVLASTTGHGAIVSNDGEIHSFAGNARQNALTPFRFESVPTSLPGQLIYVVDLSSGEVDAAGSIPFRRADARYEVVYGLGFVTFRNSRPDTELELTFFVLPSDSSDVRMLTLRNRTGKPKDFRIAPYFDIALAESPAESQGLIHAVRDEMSEALLFANPANDYEQGWAFAATSLTAATTETVRARFIGSKGRDLTNPVMVETGAADGSREDDGRRVAAFSGVVTVPANGAIDVAVVLGQAASRHHATMVASDLRDPVAARAALHATKAWWEDRLDVVRVETNDPAFDRLVNYWLPYQVLTSRLWGRTGPNQRGGATGFRDQLQDVLPFLLLDPTLARRQIALHAGQQFPEGDVLKWWHAAPDGRTGVGQRTRASDPHLWLPYVVARYLAATGDHSLLDENIPYLEGPPVPKGASDIFIAPRASRESGDVYDHCRRAIAYSLAHMGAHGLPLIGSGDWNDGIDRIGVKGRGESVWMGFFLHDVLTSFSEIARGKQDEAAARFYSGAAERLARALEQAWLGDRYALAFDDMGRVLDPQSAMTAAWPILSGAVDFERGLQALEQGLEHLEKSDRILLLDPPFDECSEPYPGRIADYPPGVRENGGQYSHGVSWTIDAYVRLAELAMQAGDQALAARLKARALTCWTKISPIGKTEGDRLAVYGLAPHQQPADIYDGGGYSGRGGWSWYTGSAARMLSTAYAILGLEARHGEIVAADDLFAPKGALQVKSISLKGQTLRAPSRVQAIFGRRASARSV